MDEVHAYAREVALTLSAPDKKQLRFNEIVAAASDFSPSDVRAGVRELVQACDATNAALYVRGDPMWATLRRDYAWML